MIQVLKNSILIKMNFGKNNSLVITVMTHCFQCKYLIWSIVQIPRKILFLVQKASKQGVRSRQIELPPWPSEERGMYKGEGKAALPCMTYQGAWSLATFQAYTGFFMREDPQQGPLSTWADFFNTLNARKCCKCGIRPSQRVTGEEPRIYHGKGACVIVEGSKKRCDEHKPPTRLNPSCSQLESNLSSRPALPKLILVSSYHEVLLLPVDGMVAACQSLPHPIAIVRFS